MKSPGVSLLTPDASPGEAGETKSVPAVRADLPLMEARDVHARYGGSHILQGVSLTIGRGEAVGLLGRNGMGKTTLIRALLGLVRSSGGRVSGEVHVAGRNVTRLPTDRIVRLGIAYVPEGRGIFPNLSVRENLVMAARPSPTGRTDWDLKRILDLFPRLAERISAGGQLLSGGEQQMLAIGRALMTNPKVILLDEATEGLAPKIVAEIWQIIKTIRAAGIASLIVDRNYRAVLTHTDRCVVLEKGHVVLEGRSNELAADPSALHRYLGV